MHLDENQIDMDISVEFKKNKIRNFEK